MNTYHWYKDCTVRYDEKNTNQPQWLLMFQGVIINKRKISIQMNVKDCYKRTQGYQI